MSIQYIERAPRRPDFCGCPPCPLCYEPVITDDQQAPAFAQTMRTIYGEGPVPQTEQEYEWAHVAAHQCRQDLMSRPREDYFDAADRARMTQMQIDDLLKRAKRAAEAPKPLNRVNLDDMPAQAVAEVSAQTEGIGQATVQETAAALRYMSQYRDAYNCLSNYQPQQSLADSFSKLWLTDP